MPVSAFPPDRTRVDPSTTMRTDDYIPPVGFAREPRVERRRWVNRIFLFLFIAAISWMLVSRVVSPPDDSRSPGPTTSQLPGPR